MTQTAGVLSLAALMCLVAQGFRNGDRPGDVVVTAVVGQAGGRLRVHRLPVTYSVSRPADWAPSDLRR